MENFDFINIKKLGGVFFFQKRKSTNIKAKYYNSPLGINSYKLSFRISGINTFSWQEESFTHEPNTILYLPKNIKTDKILNTCGESIDIFFDSDLPLFNTIKIINIEAPVTMLSLFNIMDNIWLKKSSSYYYDALSVFFKILSNIQRTSPSSNISFQTLNFQKIKKAYDYIDEHYLNENIDLNNLASLCGLSYSHFRHTFTKSLGMSPYNYILHRRIDFAKKLLVEKNNSINQIAKKVGFSDLYQFSNTFHKFTGTSPTKYRNHSIHDYDLDSR